MLSTTNQAVKLSILAGEILLASGAETNRVEDTVLRILTKCGFQGAESFATSTGVFASAEGADGNVVTMVRRVKSRANNFVKIASVNEVSRGFVEGDITVEAALTRLEEIKTSGSYPKWVKIAGASLAAFCLAAMLGGGWDDAVSALVAAFLMHIPIMFLEERNVASVLRNICGGAFAALFSMVLLNIGLGSSINAIIIGTIMPLVPGLSLTNAIRDVLEGDFISGSARILDAFLIAIAIATGVGTAMSLWYSLFGGVLIW
ncbi:MAG: threonine/serine exporter family protein [Defluviitaleaceae bacterium]|nr:threonine/serine exporter family protein [Defluviitaleaceae bacterium]